MPRQVATLVFTLIIAWLWREDNKHRPKFSKALWIPLIWLLILGSRPLSWWSWFFFGIGSSEVSDLEGNSLDRFFWTALIVVSIIVVSRRSLSWGALVRNNVGLALFLGYLGLTILWAEYPFPTAKRWFKELGAVPVLLVILTERNPVEAIKTVFSRCAYILFSFSVLVIKYIPELGRNYWSHSGVVQITGIAEQKNSLGEDVAVFGLILFWQLFERMSREPKDWFKSPALQWLIAGAMGVWLLYQSDSKTSIICLGIGCVLLSTTKIRLLKANKGSVVFICLFAVPVFYLFDNIFNISGPLLEILGRNATLTNRTEIWQAVRSHPVNSLCGIGYLNYWDVVRTVDVGGYAAALKTAHNGYLEIYLDGGYLGILFLVIMLLSAGVRHARAFVRGLPLGDLGFAFFCMTLLMNVSESIFARRSPLWSAFVMVGVAWWLFSPATENRDAYVPAALMGKVGEA
jgi:exopolysaccharide production protein ExoQ